MFFIIHSALCSRFSQIAAIGTRTVPPLVQFSHAGNLLDIAKCLRNVEKISGIKRIEVLDELKLLLADDEILYNCPDKKQELKLI